MALTSVFKKKKSVKQSEPSDKGSVLAESHSIKKGSLGNYLSKSVLKQFWQSEKANILNQINKYVFLVELNAKKPEIRKEIERKYGVKVISMNVVIQKGKTKRLGYRIGKRSDFKKAVVTLSRGQKIEVV